MSTICNLKHHMDIFPKKSPYEYYWADLRNFQGCATAQSNIYLITVSCCKWCSTSISLAFILFTCPSLSRRSPSEREQMLLHYRYFEWAHAVTSGNQADQLLLTRISTDMIWIFHFNWCFWLAFDVSIQWCVLFYGWKLVVLQKVCCQKKGAKSCR